MDNKDINLDRCDDFIKDEERHTCLRVFPLRRYWWAAWTKTWQASQARSLKLIMGLAATAFWILMGELIWTKEEGALAAQSWSCWQTKVVLVVSTHWMMVLIYIWSRYG